ncbi:MobP3 family relaxase [Hungatella hathewayi]
MPRLILKCRYITNQKRHLENLIRYIATRDGAEPVKSTKGYLPASGKQKMVISEIIREMPESRDLYEYNDYKKHPTIENASEFITTALEQNLDLIGKKKNYVDYIAHRPGVEKLGPHGLFTDAGIPIVLSEVQKEVSNHSGNVWTDVISIRREDAARLGYDQAEAWQSLLRAKRNQIADAMKIPPDQFKWYAAFHNEGHHPHVHLIAYSADAKKGYVTEKGIEQMRACLAKEIFKQELYEIYSEQTIRRDRLLQSVDDSLKELSLQINKHHCENSNAEQMMKLLSEKLQNFKGRKVYGYLPPTVKELVNQIVDELGKDEVIQSYYTLWYELRSEVLKTYADQIENCPPLSTQKELKRIKNMIIQEAVKIGQAATFVEDVGENPLDEEDVSAHDSAEEISRMEEEEKEETELFKNPFEEMERLADLKMYQADWNKSYKKARTALYGTKEWPPDHNAAFFLMQQEAETGNALAMYDVAYMQEKGLGTECQMDLAEDWYAKALHAFLKAEESDPNPYAEYRIGKMFGAGQGTSQSYQESLPWLEKAAAGGNVYAWYSLGKYYYRGCGVLQDYEEALHCFEQSENNAFADWELGRMYQNGIGCTRSEVTAERYFKEAFLEFLEMEKKSQDDKIQYRVGMMYRDGLGTRKDLKRAEEYFQKAVIQKNLSAVYALGMLYLGSGENEKIVKAVSLLKNAADKGNGMAQYTLGKLYLQGKGTEQNTAKASQYFLMSAEQGNEYAAYQLGRLLVENEEHRNIEQGIRWLSFASDKNNPYAQYQLGKLYMEGLFVPSNEEKAVQYFEKASAENSAASFRLGCIYLWGKGVEQDKKKGREWLEFSAGQGNEYAVKVLDHIDEWQRECITEGLGRLFKRISDLLNRQIEESAAHIPGSRIDRKRLKKLNARKIAQGHAYREHEP